MKLKEDAVPVEVANPVVEKEGVKLLAVVLPVPGGTNENDVDVLLLEDCPNGVVEGNKLPPVVAGVLLGN
jgi:hypothetical protein